MANLGTRSVTLLKPNDRLAMEAGEVLEAECWLNLDAYIDCAEVKTPRGTVGLGRITDGGWKYTNPDQCPHRCNSWDAAGEVLTCDHCGKDVT